jgi:hypothetical protein
MKKKLKVNKKVVKNLKLKLKKSNDRKVAPLLSGGFYEAPSNTHSC